MNITGAKTGDAHRAAKARSIRGMPIFVNWYGGPFSDLREAGMAVSNKNRQDFPARGCRWGHLM